MFPNEACAVTYTWKTYLLLKWQFKNKKWMKGTDYDITPILGSFAGNHEKRSHNRIIDWQWT